ncbi:hypothetical protein [Streptomyces cinereoruber]|uniref:hypothetical protein n=1 Tax=Streptomyces cinereoruber TaxID=67260 RepID=UPI003631B3E7
MPDDIHIGQPLPTPCKALRITPYDADGPDHSLAVTHWFREPVTLSYVTRTRSRPLTDPAWHAHDSLPSLVALTAPKDHPQPDRLDDVARRLWQRGNTYLGVEAWSREPGQDWLYLLVPRWRRLVPEDWPADVPDGHTVHAVGQTDIPGQPVAWPAPPCEYQVGPSDHVFLSTESGPPPPAGAPAPAMLAGYQPRP